MRNRVRNMKESEASVELLTTLIILNRCSMDKIMY